MRPSSTCCAIQKEIHPGIFAVMDGTICGNGPGPRTMIPVEKDYVLAGADCVAIDAVAAKMMGFDPMSIPYIRMAHEDGLGVGKPGEIDVVGEDISKVDFRFSVGDNLASRVGDSLWFGPFKPIQNLFTHTPLVYCLILGSFLYHDYCWWPTKGKSIQKAHVGGTKWGGSSSSTPKAKEEASLGDIVRILRPSQYSKNLFIFLPLFFAGQFVEFDLIGKATVTFLMFAPLQARKYIFNDLFDVSADRLHPVKKNRPIPAGRISRQTAITTMVLLQAAGLAAAFFFEKNAFYPCIVIRSSMLPTHWGSSTCRCSISS